jgi:hypothetical protein
MAKQKEEPDLSSLLDDYLVVNASLVKAKDKKDDQAYKKFEAIKIKLDKIIDNELDKIIDSLNDLEDLITAQVSSFIIKASKELFDKVPTLVSFGWAQCMAGGGPYEKKYNVFISRHQPDINGVMTDRHAPESKAVISFLEQFNNKLLIAAFGDDCEVTIFKDLTFRVT